jgi:hypothetical protein
VVDGGGGSGEEGGGGFDDESESPFKNDHRIVTPIIGTTMQRNGQTINFIIKINCFRLLSKSL